MALEGEMNSRPKLAAKFIKIPMTIHSVVKHDEASSLQIEHVQIKRASINIPKNILSLGPEEIEKYIKEVYPNARSFVIQYEKRGEESIPFYAQLFLDRRSRNF